MKISEWKTYRTRFLVQAKQLNSALTFVDHLGRQHCGRKGDYLVESSEGVLSIAPRRIFEDIYVAMSSLAECESSEARVSQHVTSDNEFAPHAMDDSIFADIAVETLEIKEIRRSAAARSAESRQARLEEIVRVRRKLPQPCRDRRSPASRLNLM